MRHRILRAFQTAIAIVCLGFAYYSARLAYAEYLFRSNVPENIASAADLVPSQAVYQERVDRLERAVRLNPYLSSAWIELGLRAEAGGDFRKAETSLNEATRVDRTFEPKWTLANFYFRRENWKQFWPAIRAAAEMSSGDRTALFHLCWQASADSGFILTQVIPPEHLILSDYIEFLVRANQLDAAEQAASRLVPLALPQDVPRLLLFCDLLIDSAHHTETATRIWNGMIERGLLPFKQPLDPFKGSSLTNGDLERPPLEHGFDWRRPVVLGVQIVHTESPPQLRIRLDGHQPEHADLLVQWLPLSPSSSYALTVRDESRNLPPDSGLRWQIQDALSGATLAGTGQENPLRQTLAFTTPPQCSLARLVLTYERAPGSSRAEGELILSSVALERRPRPHR